MARKPDLLDLVAWFSIALFAVALFGVGRAIVDAHPQSPAVLRAPS